MYLLPSDLRQHNSAHPVNNVHGTASASPGDPVAYDKVITFIDETDHSAHITKVIGSVTVGHYDDIAPCRIKAAP